MAKFLMTETIHSERVDTVRLGTGSLSAYTDTEIGKAVKFSAESRYVLAAAGDQIEAFVSSVNPGFVDGYTIGGVVSTGTKAVTFDGLQATPGTGTVAIGAYVVVGTVVAKDTALTEGVPVKVCKATIQPGTTEAGAVGDVNDQIKAAMFAWRVVSLGSAGPGAVGSVGLIQRV